MVCPFATSTWTRSRITPSTIPILKVKSHASEWSLWSGQGISQSGCSWRPKRLKRTSTPSGLSRKIAGVRSLARQVQSRVATVTLDMAEQYPNKSFWVSHVAVPRKHLGLEECIELPAHVLVAGRSADSVKCTSACRSASTSTRVSGCPRRAHSGQRKIHPFIPLPPGSPDPGPPPPTSEMG